MLILYLNILLPLKKPVRRRTLFVLELCSRQSKALYWCEVMIKANIVPVNKFALLIDEVEQIIKILTTIINKCKTKK